VHHVEARDRAAEVLRAGGVVSCRGPLGHDRVERRGVIVVLRAAGDQNVVAAVADEAVRPESADQHVPANAADEEVIAIAAHADAAAVARLEPVVARAAEQGRWQRDTTGHLDVVVTGTAKGPDAAERSPGWSG